MSWWSSSSSCFRSDRTHMTALAPPINDWTIDTSVWHVLLFLSDLYGTVLLLLNTLS